MPLTIPDITVPADQYLDLNTASGLAVGTAMEITNKGTQYIYVQESDTQPDPSSTDGVVLTNLSECFAVGTVTAGSLKIWVKSVSDSKTGLVNVQDRT